MIKNTVIVLLSIFLLVGVGIFFFADDEVSSGVPSIAEQTKQIATAEIDARGESVQTVSSRKNILLVIADDFGLDASPCHSTIGSQKPTMPHLEALCQRGTVIDEAWAAPTCTPTRATILTGKHGFRTGVLKVDDALEDQKTIFDIAGEQDYQSAVIGKWHVSGRRASADAPQQFGVEHFVGFLSGGLRDYENFSAIEKGVEKKITQYSTSYFSDQAITWLGGTSQEKPWFLWLAYNAPHTPFHVPPSSLHTRDSLSESSSDREKYFAALEALDTELGRVLDMIDMENTVVIFMGDNGTPGKVVQEPYSRRAAKGSLYQGGITVPMVVANYAVDASRPVVSVDLFPTIAGIMGDSTARADVDGISLDQSREFLFIDYEDRSGEYSFALREGDDKYLEYDGKKELHDLSSSPAESNATLQQDAARTAEVLQYKPQ